MKNKSISGHGELLEQLLNTEDVSVAEFYTWLEDEVSSITTIYNMIKSDKISKARLCLICQLFDISPTYFGLEEDAFNPRRPKNRDSSQLIQYNYYEEPASDYTNFVEGIFSALFNALENTQKSLLIMDYTERRRGINESKYGNFNEKNIKLSNNIEQKLSANPNFEYKRIMQAPYSPEHFTMGFSFEQEIEKMIGLIFEDTFRHFCYCFKQHENQFLLMLIPPVRIFSYYIFDEETVISEYLRFDKHGIPAPNLLFNNKKDENNEYALSNSLLKHYVEEIRYYEKESQKPTSYKIDKYTFIKAAINHGKNLKKSLNDLEQELKQYQDKQNAFNFDKDFNIVEKLADLKSIKQQFEIADQKREILNEVFYDLLNFEG